MSATLSPKKEVTRYGAIKQTQPKFGTEKRFKWQDAQFSSDVAYEIPDMKMSKSVVFSGAARGGALDGNPDAKKRSNGPGSYDPGECFDFLSEYRVKQASRFSCAARQSMAMKTPSPGAVYNIEGVYWNGPEKKEGIGFGNSSRKPLTSSSNSADADLYMPKYNTGKAITIAGRPSQKKLATPVPGAIYDVHVSCAVTLVLPLMTRLSLM